MFKITRLQSVWSRLAGTLVIVMLPTAALIVALAYSLYGATLQALETTETAAADGRAGELRAWLDAAGRSLANEAVAAGYLDAERCGLLAQAFLDRNEGFANVRFFDAAGAPCMAGEADDAGAAMLKEAGPAGPVYRLDIFRSRLWIVADLARGSPPQFYSSLLQVDPAALTARLRPDPALGVTEVALIDRDGDLVAGAGEAGWLPAGPIPLEKRQRWRARDRQGVEAAYFQAPLAGANLAVVMRFDDRGLAAARARLAFITVATVVTLSLLAMVYLLTVRRDVVQWVQAIDRAARAHGRDPESLIVAAVDPRMPRELRSVAEAFNAMADGARENQKRMATSLAENRALMLEMHHRIKNSLQVIQSYLALNRRTGPRAEAIATARIEARVGVLAVAYRLALTPDGMKPIEVRPFLDEIVSAAVAGLRAPRQRVARDLAWSGALSVDRAIPLGLGLVEALAAGLSAEGATYVGVFLVARGEASVELTVEGDGQEPLLPEKILRGLAAQLGATSPAPLPRALLFWRFDPREAEPSGGAAVT